LNQESFLVFNDVPTTIENGRNYGEANLFFVKVAHGQKRPDIALHLDYLLAFL
jgi:hypothetical protein